MSTLRAATAPQIESSSPDRAQAAKKVARVHDGPRVISNYDVLPVEESEGDIGLGRNSSHSTEDSTDPHR
jgi:hypothetical protein